MDNRLTVRENLSATIVEFSVTVDSVGVPKNNTQFKLLSTQTLVDGLIVLNITGAKDADLLPNSGIFVSFVRNNNFIIIQNIKGLQADKPYKVKVLCI